MPSAMKNKDLVNEERMEILQRMSKAIAENNTEDYEKAFADLADAVQQSVMTEYERFVEDNNSNILAQRGVRQLTTSETNYYNKVIEALKSNNPKQALTEMDDVMPVTIIDEVFEDVKTNHPLLDAIDFTNTGFAVRWILSEATGDAEWGDLCDPITAELGGSFSIIELGTNKLSAHMPVCIAMLDLGPVWLDRYVREVMAEKLAAGLEKGIVDGDGSKGPLGMTRKLTGAVDGVYARKDVIKVDSLTPEVYGGLLNTLSVTPKGNRRAVPEILLVVNPADYYTKIYPATTIRRTDGGYNNDVYPYPTKVVVSPAVPVNHAVAGIGKRYFMGMGTSKGGKLEHSDEYKFLEEQRTYKIKLYGNGRARDENAFVYLDITDLKPTNFEVVLIESEPSV